MECWVRIELRSDNFGVRVKYAQNTPIRPNIMSNKIIQSSKVTQKSKVFFFPKKQEGKKMKEIQK